MRFFVALGLRGVPLPPEHLTMSALTSLLARDHAVPVRKIEETLSRQVVSGGDIASVLLETDAIAENTLAAYQAALFNLLPATRDEVMRVQRDQIRLVPREVAEKHRLVPLAVDGRALLVAMAAPLDHDVESQIGFLLGYDLVIRIVCEVRICAALMHHYGVEASVRQKRLIEQLRHRDAGTVPYVAPPETGKLSLAQRGIVSKKISASAWLDEPDEPEPPPPPPPPRPSSMPPAPNEGRTTDPMGVPRSQVEATILSGEHTDPQATLQVTAQPTAERTVEVPPDLIGASLSDLAVSDAWSNRPATRGPDDAPAPPEANVDGRATSPYARAAVRPPTIDRAMPSTGALADAKALPLGPRSSVGWQSASRDADPPAAPSVSGTIASPAAAEPAASTSRTDPSVPAVRSSDRLSVAPIVGVGVRRSSRPAPGRPEPPARDRARPIVEPIVDSPPSELPPPVSPRVSSAGIEVREPIATPASELPSAVDSSQTTPQLAEAQNDRRAPRLRGPLTAAQAAKLLEDASDRDGIVAVFFAFARQFFDYAALFTLQDDRAEGRDAFGEGASAARIRAVSLTIAGDEASLFASARKSGLPQLGALSTVADLDLASVLVRPRNTFAIAYPVVIRGRPVLVLYGDRSGDRFELSDVPELVGFVRRVADALEKLILRRKRDGARGRFEKPRGEERDDLKSSASAMRSSTHPPVSRPSSARPSDARGRRREDVWSTPKLGAVVPELQPASGPSLADALANAELPAEPRSGAIESPIDANGDDLASRALDDATADAPLRPQAERTTLVDLVPAPSASAQPPSATEAFRPTEELTRVPSDVPPTDATPGRRVARKQQTMRDVLGIPRAAPPPPVVGDIFEAPLEADPANEVMLGATDALGSESLGGDASDADADDVRGPNTIPVPPPDLGDDSPELVVGDRGDDDSEPELVVGADDSDDDGAGDDSGGDDDGGDDDGGDDDGGDDQGDPTGDEAPIELKRRASPSYILRDAGVDVFEQVSPRNSQPPARKRSVPPGAAEEIGPSAGRRPDPRREEDATGPFELVTKPQRGIGAMSKSAVIEGREVDGTRPTHDRENPSVIVDMGEAANSLVEDLMHADPEGDTPVVDSLLKLGETALPALAQAFPGPLWFDRRRSYRKLPRGRDVSAVSRALVAFRERAAPYVGALAGAGAPDRRFYAVMVASEIASGALVDPLVQRVFDEDAGVRALVLEVIPKFRAFAEVQDQLVFLRRTARIRGKEPVRRLYALAALAALRDAGGLRTLVDLLEDEDAGVRRASHGALVAITCEDLGESARRWAAWSENNESRHRIEWLIDALLSSEESLRAQAGEELKTITQQYFGYHPSASRKEREVVQTKYRHWWDREGRALFK